MEIGQKEWVREAGREVPQKATEKQEGSKRSRERGGSSSPFYSESAYLAVAR